MKPHYVVWAIVLISFIPEVWYVVRLFNRTVSEANLPKITLRVNAGMLGIALVLLAIALLYDVNYLRYKAPMDYRSWKTITWADFRAIKRPRQTLHGSSTFAFITSEITTTEREDGWEVNTWFHPARSYTFSEELADENLLTHELYHLHITEYWARELRQALAEEPSLSSSTVTDLTDEYIARERAMQQTYDEETAHGYVLGKQRTWQAEVDRLLTKMIAFEDPNIKTQ